MGRFLIFAAFCLMLIPHAAQAKPGAPMPAGKVEAAQGDVSVTRRNGTAAAPLETGAVVYVADTIETGPGARVEIHFIDETSLTVGAKGKVTIDEYVFDPAAPDAGRARIGILDAAFAYAGGKLGKAKKSDVRLDLNFGSIGIRGTKILRGMKDMECWVFLEEGAAEVFNDAGGVALVPGQGTKMADWNIVPAPAQKWADADIGWIRDELKTAVPSPRQKAP